MADISSPQIEVTIITEKANLVLKGSSAKYNYSVDTDKLGNNVISCVTKRDMASDSPTFSLNIVYKKDWFHMIGSNDLIIIYMWRPPEKKQPVFFGLVDDVRKSYSSGDDKPTRSIAITGRGFSKAFINFDVSPVRETDVWSTTLGWLMPQDYLPDSTAKEAFEWILNKFVKSSMNYNFGNGRTLYTYLRTSLSSRPERLQDISDFTDFQGKLWNILKELQNPPFHELYWEIVNGLPTMVLRPTPFNTAQWNALQRHVIVDNEVIDDGIGRSDVETYTLYQVRSKFYLATVDTNQTYGYAPLWHKGGDYFRKYGVNRLDVTSLYAMFVEGQSATDIATMLNDNTVDIYNWNCKNHIMYNGQFIVKGSNRFKLGNRLYYNGIDTHDQLEYYIESVTHKFSVFDTFVTELGVTRGISPNQRFAAPWGEYERYDPKLLQNSRR